MNGDEQLFQQAKEQMPADSYDGREYTSIHSAVLFADLENSVMISMQK